MSRKRLVPMGLVAIAALALAGCSPSAPAPDDNNSADTVHEFTFAVLPGSLTYLPIYVAEEKGFLAEQNLEAELFDSAAGDTEFLAGMATDSIHATNHNFVFWATAESSDIPVDMVGPYFYVNRYVLTNSGSNIPVAGQGGATWEDTFRALEGLRVGVIAGAWTADLEALLSHVGVDPSSVTMINLAMGGPQLAALDQNEVDAVLTVPAVALGATANGDYTIATDLLEDGPEFYRGAMATGIAFTEQFLDRDPSIRERLRAAMVATIEFINNPANLDELAQIAVDNGVGGDFDAARAQIEILAPGYSATISRADVDASLDWGRQLGSLDSSSTTSATDLVIEGLEG